MGIDEDMMMRYAGGMLGRIIAIFGERLFGNLRIANGRSVRLDLVD